MPNPAVPDFTELGARKLAELHDKGYRVTGYCFERQVDGTQPQRGFVDFAGFVGWWRPEKMLSLDYPHALRFGGCPSCGRPDCVAMACARATSEELLQIAAHGVADMKGGQDVER
jgi:hypothetical protein